MFLFADSVSITSMLVRVQITVTIAQKYLGHLIGEFPVSCTLHAFAVTVTNNSPERCRGGQSKLRLALFGLHTDGNDEIACHCCTDVLQSVQYVGRGKDDSAWTHRLGLAVVDEL